MLNQSINLVMVSEAWRANQLQMSLKCISLELRPLLKLSAVHTNEGRLFQMVGVQHENRRAAVFVDEDCVDSRSDVDDPQDMQLSVRRE